MQVTQVYELVNKATQEALGDTAVLNEDLSNVVDIGEAVFNANAVDKYVKALVNHIGRVIFVNRVYRGSAPSVLMDGWEFGSVLEKVRMTKLPSATENESWELEDGQSYDPNVFTQPKVTAKFYNSKVTFEIPMSFTEMQVKQSFSNDVQLNAFVSMIYVGIDNAMTLKLDGLVMRTINAAIGEVLAAEFPTGDYSTSTVQAVNLLAMYNEKYGKTLTADTCISDPEFVRFAAYIMNLYVARLGRYSTLFNVGGTEKFTPRDMLKIVMLADFDASAKVYLYDANGQLRDENLRLPAAEIVPYWQGSGTDYAFDSVSAIDIKTPSGATVKAGGILAVMFDRDALGVANMNRRVTTNYNAKAEFYNNWYKMDAQYFLDTDENCVVFFVA